MKKLLTITCLMFSSSLLAGWGDFTKGLGDSFSKMGEDISKTVDQASGAISGDDKEEEKTPTAKPAATSSDDQNRYYKAGVKATDVSKDDLACEELIEEFSLADNVSGFLSSGLNAGMSVFTSGGDVKGSALESARSAAKQTNWLPPEVEKAVWGELLLGDAIRGNSILPRGDDDDGLYKKADAILEGILKAYSSDVKKNDKNEFVSDSFPYDVQILIREEGDGASAYAGGFIVVSDDLLEKDEAVFTISHEVSHLMKRHETRAIQAMLVDSVESVDEIKKIKDSMSNIGGAKNLLTEIIKTKAKFVFFSQSQEIAADSCGIKALALGKSTSKRDILKATNAFKKQTEKVSGKSLEQMTYMEIMQQPLFSHPASDDRKHHIDQHLKLHKVN